MAKLPEVFRRLFVKEGVLHALDALVAMEPALAPAPAADAAGPSTADEGGAGPATGLVARPKRAAAKQRRKEEESEGGPLGVNGREGSILLGRSEGEAAGPGSSVRALAHLGAGRAGLRLVAAARARRLKETYFGGSESEGVDAARLKKLKELCAQICAEGKPAEKGHKKGGKHKGKKGKERGSAGEGSDADLGALREVLDLLLEGDGVSTFEFVGSGVAPALLKLLTRGQAAGEKARERAPADAQAEHTHTLARLQQIEDMLLPATATAEDAPLTVLVRKLQAALTSLERFPVMLSQAPAGARALGPRGGGGVAVGLSALTQPFKLRLSRAPGETALRDYSSNVVLIEPLATLAAVEDFLWHRVRARSDNPSSTNGAGTSGSGLATAEAQLEAALAAAAAQFAANGRPNREERAGEGAAGSSASAGARPLTRSQKRGAAAAAASQSKRDGAGKKGAQEPPAGVEPRVTRAAARRRAEAAEAAEEQEGPRDEQQQEQQQREHDSEVRRLIRREAGVVLLQQEGAPREIAKKAPVKVARLMWCSVGCRRTRTWRGWTLGTAWPLWRRRTTCPTRRR